MGMNVELLYVVFCLLAADWKEKQKNLILCGEFCSCGEFLQNVVNLTGVVNKIEVW